MRYAVISDIHCNYPMLEYCVNDALLKNVSGFVFLGDYVSDGYAGDKVISFLKKLNEGYPCIFIYGNREKYIKSYHEMDDDYNKRFNRVSLGYESLSIESHKWINSLSETKVFFIDGLKFLLVHGDSFNRQMDIRYNYDRLLEQFDFDVCLYGHIHEARDDYYRDRRFINPGSISYPEHSDISYCIIDVLDKKVNVQYYTINVNQEFLDKYYYYLVETGFYQKNMIWTELLLNYMNDRFNYINKFMSYLSQFSSVTKNYNHEEYNRFFEQEYKKFAKENNLFSLNEGKTKKD